MYLLDMTLDAQHEDRHEKVETENRYFFGGVDMARKTRRVLGSLQKACDLKKSLYTRHTDVHAEHDSALRISGWLVKAGVQKGPVGGWKNRFCVLDGNVLSYYQPRNSVDIDSCEEQEEHAVGIAMQALQAGVGQAEDEESMELRGVIPLQEVTVHAVGPRDIKIDARWVKEGYTCCFGAHMRMRVADRRCAHARLCQAAVAIVHNGIARPLAWPFAQSVLLAALTTRRVAGIFHGASPDPVAKVPFHPVLFCF